MLVSYLEPHGKLPTAPPDSQLFGSFVKKPNPAGTWNGDDFRIQF
jgi:hypothetical protein